MKEPALVRFVDGIRIPLPLLVRLVVGGMFAYMAFMKLLDPIEFLKLTREYGVLPIKPPYFLNLTAIVVPWLEMICAVALILGIFTRGAALTIFGMLTFFTPMLLVHASGLYNAPGAAYASFCDVKFDCGCGTGEVYICSKVIENTLLWLGALILVIANPNRWSLQGLLMPGKPAAEPPDRAQAAGRVAAE